jgi:hypothetical protein
VGQQCAPGEDIAAGRSPNRVREDAVWQTLTDSKGNAYRFWKQQKNKSCGVACVMMVARLVQRKELDESTVRGWFGQIEIVGPTLKRISHLVPTGWAMEPVNAILAFGAGARDVLPFAAAFAALFVVTFVLASRRLQTV